MSRREKYDEWLKSPGLFILDKRRLRGDGIIIYSFLPGTMIVSGTVAQCVPGCSDKSAVQGNVRFLSFFLH